MKVKNILITGLPGCGKTTLIKDILKNIHIKKRGFFTDEIKEKGKRVGFKIINLKGEEGILAHKDFVSPFKVSKYYVFIENFEKIGVKEIEEGLKEDCLIVIDEIGKMELFSDKFKKVLISALDSKNKVLGTIMFKPNSFCDAIKKREDTKVFILEKNNDAIKKQIINNILHLLDTYEVGLGNH